MPGPARTVSRAARAVLAAPRPPRTSSPRALHTSSPRRAPDAAPLPPRKPVGAFRGGLFGFLLGCVLSGSAVYVSLVQEYKTSNDMLTEDIYALQKTVTRLAHHLDALEQQTQKSKDRGASREGA